MKVKFITGEALAGRVLEARPVTYQGVEALEVEIEGRTVVVPRDWAGNEITKKGSPK